MEKPSFMQSVRAGTIGMVQGALALGALGMLTGGAIGAMLGIGNLALAGSLALATGTLLGSAGVAVGAFVGAITGVVQNREAGSIDPQDIVNMNNITFARGIEIGKEGKTSPETLVELKTAATFQEKLATQQKQEYGQIVQR